MTITNRAPQTLNLQPCIEASSYEQRSLWCVAVALAAMDQVMDGGFLPLETWFWEMPTCTRWWTVAAVLTSALVQCQMVTPFQLFYSFRAVFVKSQVNHVELMAACSLPRTRGKRALLSNPRAIFMAMLLTTRAPSTGDYLRRSSTSDPSHSTCSSTSTSSSDTPGFWKSHLAAPRPTSPG